MIFEHKSMKYWLMSFGLILAMNLTSTMTLAEQSFSVTRISEKSNVRSDRRPVPVGFHDAASNRTFVCWMGANSHPIVKMLDHGTGEWSEDRVVAQSPFADKHNYPTMLKGPDGRLFVFYGCHNSPVMLATSPEPLSIDGDWEQMTITEARRASYPAPVLTTDGTFYVFYRETRRTSGHSDDRPYDMVKSTDNGRTWTHQRVIDPYPRTTDNMCEVYNGKVSYQPPMNGHKGLAGGRIHIAWTIAGEKLGRHAHATYGRNVYYAYLDPATDRMYNIRGEDLGPTIDSRQMDEHCLVLDTGIPERSHAAGLQVSVHWRDNGSPIIHFDNRNAGGIGSAMWDGSEWVFTTIEPRGGDPREIEKCGPDSFRVYRPRGETIDVFRTDDAGLNWAPETTIQVGQRVDRVFVIDNFHPDAKLLITEAGDNTVNEGIKDVFIGRVTSGFEPPYHPPGVSAAGE